MKRTIVNILKLQKQVEQQIEETKARIFLAAVRGNYKEVEELTPALRSLESDYYEFLSQIVEIKPIGER